jgi:hypothetical protein
VGLSKPATVRWLTCDRLGTQSGHAILSADIYKSVLNDDKIPSFMPHASTKISDLLLFRTCLALLELARIKLYQSTSRRRGEQGIPHATMQATRGRPRRQKLPLEVVDTKRPAQGTG